MVEWVIRNGKVARMLPMRATDSTLNYLIN